MTAWIYSFSTCQIFYLICLFCVFFCSVAQSCLILCDPMNCSIPGFPVFHHLPEFIQTHVHWVSDAIQPSNPLSSISPPALILSKHRGLFQWIKCQVANVLELQLQHQSFQWIFRVHFLQDWLVWPSCCLRDSQKSFPAPQFESISSSKLSLLYWLFYRIVLALLLR